MGRLQHFPRSCRYSNLTFLPSRSIFSLEFLPKLLEVGTTAKMDEVAPSDKVGQMAYERNRSCGLALFIDSIVIEKAEEPVVKFDADFKKAFDTVHRGLAIANLHRKTGCGRLLESWFEGRVYKFGDKTRGLDFNCGGPPGTLVGVKIFSNKIELNDAMAIGGRHNTWLYNHWYADDTSPSALVSKLYSGELNCRIAESVAWANEVHMKYHGVGTKKGPVIQYLRREDDPEVDLNHTNKPVFDGESIPVESSVKRLGIHRVSELDSSKMSAYQRKYRYH